jgi:hypothetical protein
MVEGSSSGRGDMRHICGGVDSGNFSMELFQLAINATTLLKRLRVATTCNQ